MNNIIFEGSCVALVTPFKNGQVDYENLKKLIEYQIENKTDAILVLGTTAETPTLSVEEKHKIIDVAKNTICGRTKLIIGTGGNNTEKVIEDTKYAKEQGADGVLVVTPYYNKCTQNGLFEHYKFIAESVDIPILLYNVPGRTGVNILPETAERLSHIKNITGIKEASGNISQICTLCNLLEDKMAVYSGDDGLNYVFLTLGAKGVISVTANPYPDAVKKAYDLFASNKIEMARQMHEKLLALNNAMFIEVNPIPVKTAMEIKNLCLSDVRMPLTRMEEVNKQKLQNIMKNFETQKEN